MADNRIIPVVMPKWGLSMSEGKLTGWLVEDGKRINVGEAILEVETDKIAGAVESGDAGTLRRRVGEPGTIYPVKALLGVIADDSVTDKEIDDYVASYVTPPPEEGEEEAGPKYEFVDLPDGRVRYAKRGTGDEKVVLIHGFGGDLDNWLFNIDALAENATVYALDLPGHGQSVKSMADPSLKVLAMTVVSFMNAMEIKSAHLIGHSLGGAIAMEIAREARDRVKSVTAIATVGLGPDINIAYIDGFISSSSRRDLKPVIEQLFANPALVTRQLIDDLLKYKRLDGVDQALRGLAASVFPQGRQAAKLDLAGVPALVIWGSEDKIIPASHASSAKGAKVEVIEGAGHMVQMEQAGKVNALIKAHIAG
jgi:pyruvate dehydrogenase E2 component (dihydrolipoamide acetyltransferase)